MTKVNNPDAPMEWLGSSKLREETKEKISLMGMLVKGAEDAMMQFESIHAENETQSVDSNELFRREITLRANLTALADSASELSDSILTEESPEIEERERMPDYFMKNS